MDRGGPGGALIVEDADFEAAFCDPPNDGHEFWKRTYCTVLECRGGDPLLGRKLNRYFSAAGIPDPHLDVVQLVHTSGDPKTLPLLTLEATADAVLAEGVASEEEVTAAVTSLTSFTTDPGTVVGSPRIFQVWAEAPGRGRLTGRRARRRAVRGARPAERGWRRW